MGVVPIVSESKKWVLLVDRQAMAFCRIVEFFAMKHLLPGKTELMIFLTLAILCTGIVAISPKMDLGLAGLAVPIFISSAVMGLRRNWKLAEVREESMTRSDSVGTKEVA